jgi:tripartite-type tricarboxylate transporter receptor subunit TctC
MKTTHLTAALIIAATCATGAQSQTYPVRAVRIIVPFAAGGNVDLVARAIGPQLASALGQQVIVENRPGASGLPGTQFVARAPADGYTMLAMANTFAVVPSLLGNPGYDPLKDFAGISLTCFVPQVLVVNTTLPVRSVKDLVALAKARPGQISYASAGIGGTGHMAAELFNSYAKIKMLHVPYKGNSQAVVDVISGQVMMMFDQVSTSAAFVKAGKLRALAVTSRTRSPLMPELPTIAESGVPGYEDITFNGLMAPAGTPHDILVRLNAEVAKIVRDKKLHDRFIERGVELISSPSPEDFTAYVKAEFEKKGKLIRQAGIKVQ